MCCGLLSFLPIWSPSANGLYYLLRLRVPCLSVLAVGIRGNGKANFVSGKHNVSLWAKLMRSGKRHPRRLRFGILLVVFFSAGIRTVAQEALPPAVEAKIGAAIQELQSGDLDLAENTFSDVLRQGIKHPLIYHNLGIIALLRSNHAQAVTRFRQTLALQPDNASSRLLLGMSLLALKKNAEAVRELKRAATLLPEKPEAHLQLARAYEVTEDWIAAAQEFQKLVQLAPQEPSYSYQLWRAWMKLSDWSYRQIIGINPNSARVQQAMGLDYAAQEKYDLALAAYQRAARSDPKLPEIHLAMALIWLEMKKFDEALAEIDLELEVVPESEAAAETKAKIETAKATFSP
jgi:tetratricopeptide (TPR) repeat protein